MNKSNIHEVFYWEAFKHIQDHISPFLWFAIWDDLHTGLEMAINGAASVQATDDPHVKPYTRFIVQSANPYSTLTPPTLYSTIETYQPKKKKPRGPARPEAVTEDATTPTVSAF